MTPKNITIQINSISLEGNLSIPENSKGVVIFAHGTGSSRFSPRNNFVSSELNKIEIGTLLFDLLTKDEDTKYENRFNIPLLSNRLMKATSWFINEYKNQNFKIGYFGASTGAAAALIAASELGKTISCVVSRGGRPDLAKGYISKVISPTLLIVGGKDDVVIKLNQEVFKLLNVEKGLEIIEGATHLFEEPGTLEKVSSLASNWFKKYLYFV